MQQRDYTTVRFEGTDAEGNYLEMAFEYGQNGYLFPYKVITNGKGSGVYRNLDIFTEVIADYIERHNLRLIEGEGLPAFTISYEVGMLALSNGIPDLLLRRKDITRTCFIMFLVCVLISHNLAFLSISAMVLTIISKQLKNNLKCNTNGKHSAKTK